MSKKKSYNLKKHIFTVSAETLQELKISFLEAGLLQIIYQLSYNHTNKERWCYASKDSLASTLQIGRATVFRTLETLEKKGFLERKSNTQHIRPTDKYCRLFETHKTGDSLNMRLLQEENQDSINPEIVSKRDYQSSQNDTTDSIKMRPKYINSNNKANSKAMQESKKQTPAKKNYKNPYCSTKWYEEVFEALYIPVAEQPLLYGGAEARSHSNLFKRLKKLNPDFTDKQIYERATECAMLMINSYAEGSDFTWVDSTPDIKIMVSQIAKLNESITEIKNRAPEDIEEIDRNNKLLKELEEIQEQTNSKAPKQIEPGKGLFD